MKNKNRETKDKLFRRTSLKFSCSKQVRTNSRQDGVLGNVVATRRPAYGDNAPVSLLHVCDGHGCESKLGMLQNKNVLEVVHNHPEEHQHHVSPPMVEQNVNRDNASVSFGNNGTSGKWERQGSEIEEQLRREKSKGKTGQEPSELKEERREEKQLRARLDKKKDDDGLCLEPPTPPANGKNCTAERMTEGLPGPPPLERRG